MGGAQHRAALKNDIKGSGIETLARREDHGCFMVGTTHPKCRVRRPHTVAGAVVGSDQAGQGAEAAAQQVDEHASRRGLFLLEAVLVEFEFGVLTQ